ncbi:zinc finger protein, partial [Lecanoromycetidae sp. Uapishka_2]
MADRATNEYLNTERAKNDENDLFAAIGQRVLGLNLGDQEEPAEDERVRIGDEIESMCMNCHKDGVTRLLFTKIPFFREIVLMSFYCEHCGLKNNEVQPAGEIQQQGVKYTFKLDQSDDLERQIVKSDTCTLRIEDIDLEVPAGRGRLTNVEGILAEVLKDLEAGQKKRKKEDREMFEKIEAVAQSLVRMINSANCTISLDDPAGNSWIEPATSDSTAKGKYTRQQYPRTSQQNADLGLGESQIDGAVANAADDGGGMDDVDIVEGKAYELPIECPGCTYPAIMIMQMVNIPYFQQVILSTTQCSHCGYRTNDVKTGGEVPEMGKRIFLHVKDAKDLSRDILKSETCLLKIDECNVEVQPGTMGGRFTTIEGLLTQIRDDLKTSIYDIGEDDAPTDSMPEPSKQGWKKFFAQMDKAIGGDIEFTIVMEDPLANSYCQTFGEPGEDPNVRIEEYERTEEEEDDLGHADMKTHLNEDGEYVREPPKKGKEALKEIIGGAETKLD